MITFENKRHFGVLVICLFIIASENINLVMVEGSPATAAQQTELALNIFDSWIHLAPEICAQTINLYKVTVSALRVNSS